MDELELFNRLIEIRDEAYDAGRWRVTKMLDKLITDRWGKQTPKEQ